MASSDHKSEEGYGTPPESSVEAAGQTDAAQICLARLGLSDASLGTASTSLGGPIPQLPAGHVFASGGDFGGLTQQTNAGPIEPMDELDRLQRLLRVAHAERDAALDERDAAVAKHDSVMAELAACRNNDDQMPGPVPAVAEEDVYTSPWSSVRARSPWKGALLLGTVGGFVVGGLIGWTRDAAGHDGMGPWLPLIGLACGILFFGACGFCCLSADKEVDNPTVRCLLEGMVVVGWGSGVLYRVLWNFVNVDDTHWIFLVFFIPSPIYFTVLCWHNVDWRIMQLLSQQFQFKVVVGLTLWIMVMWAWKYASLGLNTMAVICLTNIMWSPLLMILFIDAIKRQSKLFRFVMPAVYLLYVLVCYIEYGYQFTPTRILPEVRRGDQRRTYDPNYNQTGEIGAAATFESQISSALSTITILMMSFMYNALADRSGTAVLFPIRFATVLKSAVPYILEAGTWMRTEVDEDGQRLMLVAKYRRSSASLRMANGDEDVLTLPVVVPAPPLLVGE